MYFVFKLEKNGRGWKATDDMTTKMIYEPKKWGVNEAWRKLHSKELIHSSNIIAKFK